MRNPGRTRNPAPGARVPKTGRGPGFWSIYLLVTLATSLLGLEGMVRLLDLAPRPNQQTGWLVPDPHVPYRPRPLSVVAGRSATDEYDFEHRHNSAGFRDFEQALDKPEGVFRILGLGDSFTAGWGAAFEETYLRRLEVALNARPGRHPRVEIIKAGINGYFPQSERLLLEHYGLRYAPDLILVGFVPNDLIDTNRGLSALRVSKQGYLTSGEAAEIGELGIWLYMHSHVARILLKAYVDLRTASVPDDWWRAAYTEGGPYEKAWTAIQSEYETMQRLAREHGARLVILHIPGNVSTDIHEYPARRLGQWCAAQGLEFIDALPELRRASQRGAPLYWKKDPHCTPAGYAAIADALFAALTERGLVP